MKLQTLADIEHAIGGRPKLEDPKIRLSFYLSSSETQQLKAIASHSSLPLSQFIRAIINRYLADNEASL